ncbi:MAG: histidine phosphotransferase family protein [Pseudomonadota bacterium]
MSRASDLAGLVSARLCHDLISPIGAISNGVELLTLSQSFSSESQLIADSVDTAKNRVKFFRLAFGLAPVEGMAEVAELARLAPAQLNHRVTVKWPEAPEPLSRRHAQGVLLGLMCLERCLPRGGQIAVSLGKGWADLTATGPRVEGDGAGWAALDGVQVRHGDVQFAYLAALCDEGAFALTRSEGADQVTLQLTFPP